MGNSDSTPAEGWDQYKKYAPGGEWESYAPPIPPPQRTAAAYRSKFVGLLRGYNSSALAETGCELVPGDLERLPTYWEAVKGAAKWSDVDPAVQIRMEAYQLQRNHGDISIEPSKEAFDEPSFERYTAYADLKGLSREAAQAAYIRLYREYNDQFCPKPSSPLDELDTLEKLPTELERLTELKRLAIEYCGLTFREVKSLSADELRTRIEQDWDSSSVRGPWDMREELDDAFERYSTESVSGWINFDYLTHPRDPEPPLWFDMSDEQAILRYFDADREDRRMLTLLTGLRSDKGHPLHNWSREAGMNVLQLIADLVSEQRDAVRKRAVDCVDAAERSYLCAWAEYRHKLDEAQTGPELVGLRMLGGVNGRSGFGLIGGLGWDGDNLMMRV